MTRRVVLLGVLLASIGLAQTIPSYKQLVYPPLKQVKIRELATFTLKNGMRVLLLEDHELPLINGLALIRTGNLFDPPDKRGLSSVMADVLRSGGTSARTGDQIDEDLENIAASVESSMGETSASISFSGLKETTGTVLGILKSVMTDPEFRQDKIDLTISQAHSGIDRRNDDAQGIAEREISSILYGRDNSYGWTIEHADLARIQRKDLQEFYHRYNFPKNIILAVYGDFSTPDMKEQLEKLFADWTPEEPPVPPFPAVDVKPAPAVFLAEKSDVTQTFFSLGLLSGTLRDPDYPALEVAVNILGSGFTSRLMSQIRTKMGLAYSIGAGWGAAYDHPGTFRIVGSTKSSSTTDAILAARNELRKDAHGRSKRGRAQNREGRGAKWLRFLFRQSRENSVARADVRILRLPERFSVRVPEASGRRDSRRCAAGNAATHQPGEPQHRCGGEPQRLRQAAERDRQGSADRLDHSPHARGSGADKIEARFR